MGGKSKRGVPRFVVEQVAEIIAVIDLDGQRAYLTDSVTRVLGLEQGAINGRSLDQIFDAANIEALLGAIAEPIAVAGAFPVVPCELTQVDGHKRRIDVTATTLGTADGRRWLLLQARDLAGPDIQEILDRSERRYRVLVDQVSDVISVLGADGQWIESSAAGSRLMGYPQGFSPAGGLFSLLHPDDVALATRALAEVVEGRSDPEESFECRVRAADGEWRWFESKAKNLIDNEDVGGVVITSRDITARRKADELLRESEERFRILAETAAEGITIGEGGRVVNANSAFAALYGYEPTEVIGMPVEAFIAPESRAGVLENIDAERQVQAEFVALRKDGSRFLVSVNGRTATYQGRPVRVTAITDLTDFKRNATLQERRRIARDLHDGLAHELAYIAGTTRALLGDPNEKEVIRQLANAAERALDEARRAISVLSNDQPEPLVVSITQTAEDLTLRYGLKLSLDLQADTDVSSERCEALLRILREAITNAGRHAKARHVGVRLWVDAAAHLEVSDDGIGFDPAQPGDGFGLVSMRERAEAIGAALTIVSQPGHGTRVEVVLP